MLLGAALAFQGLLGNDLDLPLPGPVRGPSGAVQPADRPRPATGGPAVLARSMFAPVAGPASEAGSGQGPLGAYAVVGSIQVGRTAYAVVRAQDSSTFRAKPGGKVGEWRIQAVTRDEVRLSRGGERLTVRFGPSGPFTVTATSGGTQ